MVITQVLLSLLLFQTPTPRPQSLDPRSYNWVRVVGSASAGVSGNLSAAGAGKTLTIPLCPAGLAVWAAVSGNGSIYISGGTGTAEAARITALSGGTFNQPCTITITTVNSHTGTWQIQSSTSGVNEAIMAGGVNGTVRIGDYRTVYDEVMIPGGLCTSLRGGGPVNTGIQSTFLSGDIVVYEAGGCTFVDFGDMAIFESGNTARTSGVNVRVRYRFDGQVTNVYAKNCYECFEVERNARVVYNNLTLTSAQAEGYGLRITCHGVTLGAGCQNQGEFTNIYAFVPNGGVTNGYGVLIEDTSTGMIFSNVFTESGRVSFGILIGAAGPMNEIVLTNSVLDNADYGLAIGSAGIVAYNNNSIQVSNSRITSRVTPVFMQGWVQDVHLNNNWITGINAGSTGVLLDGVNNVYLVGNNIAAATTGVLTQNATRNIYILGGKIGYGADGTATGAATTGIGLGGTLTNAFINGVDLYGAVNLTVISGTGSYQLQNMPSLDRTTTTVASAGVISAGVTGFVSLTGSTAITTINGGWAGRKVTFVKADVGSVAINTGGNVLTPTALPQNGVISCSFDSTNWFCSPDTNTISAISPSPFPAADNQTLFKNFTDGTKLAKLDLSRIATATTRTFSFPDATGTLALPSIAQTWTADQTHSAHILWSSNNSYDVGALANAARNVYSNGYWVMAGGAKQSTWGSNVNGGILTIWDATGVAIQAIVGGAGIYSSTGYTGPSGTAGISTALSCPALQAVKTITVSGGVVTGVTCAVP